MYAYVEVRHRSLLLVLNAAFALRAKVVTKVINFFCMKPVRLSCLSHLIATPSNYIKITGAPVSLVPLTQ
jgi:hypothetical protein